MNIEKFYTNVRENILPSFLLIFLWLSLYCTVVLAFLKPFQLLTEIKWFSDINVWFLKQNIKKQENYCIFEFLFPHLTCNLFQAFHFSFKMSNKFNGA